MNLVYILRIMLIVFSIVLTLSKSLAQADKDGEEPLKHHNIVLTMGHALIPTAEEDGVDSDPISIPSWGLSYEYRFSHRFLLGVKGEVEISNYVIYNDEGEGLKREYPFALILNADVRIVKELYIYVGPGIEFSNDDNLFVGVIGLLYEFEIPGGWAIVPEISFEQKGGHAWAYAVGFGIAKIF